MNSKIIFFFIGFFTLTSCGVKAPPEKYPDTTIDSYIQKYTGGPPTPEEIERAKKIKNSEAEIRAKKEKDDAANPLGFPKPVK